MTISYSHEVSSASFGRFARLLLRWRGSVYRLLYKEFAIYLVLYVLTNLVYRFALSEAYRRIFEQVALYCEKYTRVAPVTFLLGFYVSFIAGRWWQTFRSITWSDRLNITVSCLIEGSDREHIDVRKTIVRYANLAQVLVLRNISKPIHERYPTLNYLVQAGYITETELVAYENTKAKMHKFWVPLQWAYSVVIDCRRKEMIRADIYAVQILNEIMAMQKSLHELLSYDWITVPLVYTQVVTIAVYSYFMASLFSRQYLDPAKHYSGYEFDLYFPWITVFEFFFYMGWLKVAESIMNPLGDDDDDIEVGRIIDRNKLISNEIMENNPMDILKRQQCYGEHEAMKQTETKATFPSYPALLTKPRSLHQSQEKYEPDFQDVCDCS